ncbi:MAG: DUF1223 domain-containing protein [Pseudomonadota bacterium]
MPLRQFAMTVAAGALSLFGLAADPVTASPVLVELYTSQGCSSCPPADALLAEMVEQDDVIALTLNVDYWDYLGWRDKLAKPEHTARQRAYQKAWMARSIYTPQIVVQGETGVIGSRRGEVFAAINRHAARPAQAAVSLAANGGTLNIGIEPLAEGVEGPASVWLVSYTGPHVVPIGRGENAGRQVTYHNVSRSIDRIAEWDCRTPVSLTAEIDPAVKGYAVIVQKDRVGPVLAAARWEPGQ